MVSFHICYAFDTFLDSSIMFHKNVTKVPIFMVSGVRCQSNRDVSEIAFCDLSSVSCVLYLADTRNLKPLALINQIDKINPCRANCWRMQH